MRAGTLSSFLSSSEQIKDQLTANNAIPFCFSTSVRKQRVAFLYGDKGEFSRANKVELNKFFRRLGFETYKNAILIPFHDNNMSLAWAIVTEFKNYFVPLWPKKDSEQLNDMGSIVFQYRSAEVRDGFLSVDDYMTDQCSDVIKTALLDIFKTSTKEKIELFEKCLEVSRKMEYAFDDAEGALALFVMRNRLRVNAKEGANKKVYNYYLKPIETAIDKIESGICNFSSQEKLMMKSCINGNNLNIRENHFGEFNVPVNYEGILGEHESIVSVAKSIIRKLER